MRKGMEGWSLHAQKVEHKIYENHFSTNFTNLLRMSKANEVHIRIIYGSARRHSIGSKTFKKIVKN